MFYIRFEIRYLKNANYVDLIEVNLLKIFSIVQVESSTTMPYVRIKIVNREYLIQRVC